MGKHSIVSAHPHRKRTFIGGCAHFHFYTSEANTKWTQSGHCAALIREYDAAELAIERGDWPPSVVVGLEDGDGGDDLFLPQIDSEGNEIVEFSDGSDHTAHHDSAAGELPV